MNEQFFSIQQFTEDMLGLYYGEFSQKYRTQIPDWVTIQQIMDYLDAKHLYVKMIDPNFEDVNQSRFPINIFQNEKGQYVNYSNERGGKMIHRVGSNLKEAVREKIEMILNDQGHAARDSHFGRPKS